MFCKKVTLQGNNEKRALRERELERAAKRELLNDEYLAESHTSEYGYKLKIIVNISQRCSCLNIHHPVEAVNVSLKL